MVNIVDSQLGMGNMTTVDGTTAQQLKTIVERVERLHEEKKALDDDVRDVYAEAKSNGFDVKAIKHIIAERRKDPAQVRESEAIIDTYKAALASAGMKVAA
jgi:uncharacterized protein (UPF0335 family)